MREYYPICIFTDGSCDNNSTMRVGAHSFVCYKKDKLIYSNVDYNIESSNNREELCAVINAMEWAISRDIAYKCTIFTDSKYVHTGITEWMYNWAKSYFKTCKNADLWKKAYEVKSVAGEFDIKWVKGHSGSRGNDLAHELAYQYRKKIINKINKQ